ncbi:MAG: hypothetical protein WC083_07690 [Candidatus Methanomethylophilaceae archaeon]
MVIENTRVTGLQAIGATMAVWGFVLALFSTYPDWIGISLVVAGVAVAAVGSMIFS